MIQSQAQRRTPPRQLFTSIVYLQCRTSYSTLCLKKVPTFQLSLTLSNLNRFPKPLQPWKAYKIC